MNQEKTFEHVYRDELEQLYDAEQQIVSALPGIIEAASSEELKSALETHLEETREQVKRLERVFAQSGAQPSGSKQSDGMRSLLAEGRLKINEVPASPVLDTAIISAAQKVEHFEISGYGTARSMAEMLGHEEAAALLEKTLEEERDTDAVLTDIAESIMSGEEFEEVEIEEEEQKPRTRTAS